MQTYSVDLFKSIGVLPFLKSFLNDPKYGIYLFTISIHWVDTFIQPSRCHYIIKIFCFLVFASFKKISLTISQTYNTEPNLSDQLHSNYTFLEAFIRLCRNFISRYLRTRLMETINENQILMWRKKTVLLVLELSVRS